MSKTGNLRAELDGLNSVLSEIDEKLNQLSSALSPILFPAAALTGKLETAKSRPAFSSLTLRVLETRDLAERVRNGISDLSENLDL